MSETHEPPHELEAEVREPDLKVSADRLFIRAAMVVGVLLIGIAILVVLLSTRPEAPKNPPAYAAPIVETVRVTAGPQRGDVRAAGTVVPARQVVIAAEVGGRVTWLDPELEPGGRFVAGKPLLRVDARDYQLAAEQQAAQVTQARTQLELERSRRRVAEKEWEAFGEKPPEGSVAIRDPQIKAAEGAVAAAESGLKRTRLAVSKTGLVAPFPAMVLSRQVDLGQLVAPGTPLATLVGIEQFWVQVSIPIERLPWIAIPGVAGVPDGGGAVAIVEQRLGAEVVRRQGRVVRLAGDVDPVGRMARVLVEIDDPLGLRDGAPAGMPLLLNSYVDVTIEGKELDGVAEVPRTALRGETAVWTVQDGKLAIRPIEVVWRRPASVLVRGLESPAEVISSPLATVVDGMAVRVRGDGGAEAARVPGPEAEPAP
jgi:RND family efflux transporter MFP subunit